MPRTRFRGTALLGVSTLAVTSMAARAQSDVVLFKNGDRLTGEIKFLDRGRISFDTPATGVIKIEWDDIEQLYSQENFELVLESGTRLYGTFAATERSGELRLESAAERVDVPMPAVVRITPIEGAVIERIEMSVDLGYSLAKADDLVQTNAGYDFRYRDEQRQVRLNVDASTSDSEDDEANTRALTSLAFRRFRQNREWDPFALAHLERNDELGIKLRTSVGGGMSHWVRDTNDSRISFQGGLVYSREEEAENDGTIGDVEAMLGIDLEWFRYDEPELDVSTQITLFRRLSGSEEHRGNLDLTLRWEVFKDFFWGISVYYTSDQQQSGIEEETTDYGTFTSLGWKF